MDLLKFYEILGNISQGLKIVLQPIDIKNFPQAKPLIVNKGKIIFENVQFNYPNLPQLFQNKSVVIDPGEKVGLVGYSGSGKSTFINLILRLYEVNQGRILIDDQDIKLVTQDSLRNNITILYQDPSLFHRSVVENISYGKPESSIEEIITAAIKAHAHDFIIKLPQGYNTILGEKGVKLSGGQRQRIAIARAILKNSPILILDEATSQLDVLTEEKIQSSLSSLMENKTVIVIAHRLSTLLKMDRIIVFDNGKIVQSGNHYELLAVPGLYKMLWNAQVNGFLLDNDC
jgi:ATP-binding cassette subfamily B protein